MTPTQRNLARIAAAFRRDATKRHMGSQFGIWQHPLPVSEEDF